MVRRWWPDRNPLRRRWDRVEAAVVAVLIAAFLAGAPLAAIMAGAWASGAARHAQQSQQAALRQVPAVLVVAAPDPANAGYTADVVAQARATWTAPDGLHRAGDVLVTPGTRAGSRVKVWVNQAGQLTGPPLLNHQVTEQAVLAAVAAAALLGMLLAAAGLVVHRVLDVRRMAAWDDGWQAAGPRWSRHH